MSSTPPYCIDRERIVEESTPGRAVAQLVRMRVDCAWAALVLAHGPLTCLAALVDDGGARRVEEVASVLERLDHAAAATLRRLDTPDPDGGAVPPTDCREGWNGLSCAFTFPPPEGGSGP